MGTANAKEWAAMTNLGLEEETTMFQTPKTKRADRSDHIWIKMLEGYWKCMLCGGITHAQNPPEHPTPKDWCPEKYEILCDEERQLAPIW